MIYESLEEYRPRESGAYVALGFFDGVHIGHRSVITSCVDDSGALSAVVLTFRESPQKALGRSAPPLLTSNARKAALMEKFGADEIIFADFSGIKDESPADFVRKILYDKLNAKRVYCGFNYRFGADGIGDTEMLKMLCESYGIEVVIKEPVYLENEQVSSSLIRKKIAAGEIKRANEMLGYCYTLEGDISSGNHIGTSMGFPTVNIPIAAGVTVPHFGVYASDIVIDGKVYRGATNIGVHPTVGENKRPLCETFLLNFEGGDLYGKSAVCALRGFIRPEMHFASIEELKAQVKADCEKIAAL